MSYACEQGMFDTVSQLIQRHAYVNTVDKVSEFYHSMYLNDFVFSYLKKGDPVLFAAVKGGEEECVALLLENHADVNAIGAVSGIKCVFAFMIHNADLGE